MKKALLAITFALVLALTATHANAAITLLETDASRYIGSITPDIPASPTDEVGYINYLIDLAPNATGSFDGQTFVRSSLPGPFPDASLTGSTKVDGGSTQITLSSTYTYLLAKYDADKAGALVWLISDVPVGETINIQPQFNGHDLSHFSLYNPGTSAPDGGLTLMMLGSALGVVGVLRRRARA